MLAYRCRDIARIAEYVCNCSLGGVLCLSITVCAGASCVAACEDGISAGDALTRLAVGSIEEDAGGCDAIHIGCADLGAAITAKGAGVMLVGHYEDNVWPFGALVDVESPVGKEESRCPGSGTFF